MMSVFNFLHHPVAIIILKMLLLVFMLVWINRLRLHARNKALLWQIGLVFLVMLPAMQLIFPAFHLAVLPALNNSHEVVKLSGNSIELMTTYYDDALPIVELVFLSVIISFAKLVSLVVQLFNLHKVTRTAKPLTQKPASQVIENSLKHFKFGNTPKVLQSPHISTPCTWGGIRPVILLPTDINDNQTLKVVLLHELAHVQRKDWLWLMLSQLMVALFWFNPLVWYVQKQMIHSCESACDEWVLQQQIHPSEYAETLLAFHQPSSARQVLTTNMAQPSEMYQRLHQILTPRRKNMKKRNQSWLLGSLFTAFILLSTAQLTAAHDRAVPEANLTAPVAEAAPMPEAPPAAPSTPEAVPQPEHPATSINRVPPTTPVLPASPAPGNVPQTRIPPAGAVVPKPPRPDMARRIPNLNRPNGEQLRAERARMQAENQRIRAEERVVKAESLQLQRQLAQLDLQKRRFDEQKQQHVQLREKAAKQRVEAQRMAEKARIARLKELEDRTNAY